MNINDFLSGMNPKTLSEGIKKAQAYLQTDEGKEMMAKLRENPELPCDITAKNKEEIMEQLRQNPDLMQKMNDILKN